MTVTLPTVPGPSTPVVANGGSGARAWVHVPALAAGLSRGPHCSHLCNGRLGSPTRGSGAWLADGGLSNCQLLSSIVLLSLFLPPPLLLLGGRCRGPGRQAVTSARPGRTHRRPEAAGDFLRSDVVGAGLGGTGRKRTESLMSGGSRSTWVGQWKSPQADSRSLLGGRPPPATFLLIDSITQNKERSRPGKSGRAPAAGRAARELRAGGTGTRGRSHRGPPGGWAWGALGLGRAAGSGKCILLRSHLPTLMIRTVWARRPRARGGDPVERAAGGANCKRSGSPPKLRSRAAPASPGVAAGLVGFCFCFCFCFKEKRIKESFQCHLLNYNF